MHLPRKQPLWKSLIPITMFLSKLLLLVSILFSALYSENTTTLGWNVGLVPSSTFLGSIYGSLCFYNLSPSYSFRCVRTGKHIVLLQKGFDKHFSYFSPCNMTKIICRNWKTAYLHDLHRYDIWIRLKTEFQSARGLLIDHCKIYTYLLLSSIPDSFSR